MPMLGLAFLLTIVAQAPAPQAPAAASPSRARAAAAVAKLKGSLVSELQKQIAAGGPASAVGTCGEVAARVAAEQQGPELRLGRTSSRLRNPANVAPAWVAPLLAELEAAPKDKRGPREVLLEGGRFGYVEPLVTAPFCLACHGEALAPEVTAALAKKYPLDKAVGFREGELRGVAWVELGPPARAALPTGAAGQATGAIGTLFGSTMEGAAAPVEVKGTLSKDEIRRVVQGGAAALRACYDGAKKRPPGVVKLSYRWTIGPDGKVTSTEVVAAEPSADELAACVAGVIAGWTFPAPKGGGVVIVNYPFVFKPAP
ncbi:MAG: AgmX/PglI C-terminal domain-containing protein [Deltaproteobacteria bacterium]|nr:AgmX/PglI C-terminal domain-containing protein [Deltaproteobacteria bacterium]